MYIDGRNRLVRPWVWRTFVGDWPVGNHYKYGVFMTCKNRWCVNSEHMTLGVQYTPGRWTVLSRAEALVLSGSEE